MITQISNNILPILSDILKSAYYKVNIEIDRLKKIYLDSSLNLKEMAIKNLIKRNSDVQTLKDFEDLIAYLNGETATLPSLLKSDTPLLGFKNIYNKDRAIYHGHIRINGEFDSITWCESFQGNGMTILAIDKHPKDSYKHLINKSKKNAETGGISVLDATNNLKKKSENQYHDRNKIEIKTKNNRVKRLHAIAYDKTKTIMFYRGNNTHYLFYKIKNDLYIYCEISKSSTDRLCLNLDKFGNLQREPTDITDIFYNHALNDELYLIDNKGNQRKLTENEFNIYIKSKIIFIPDDSSDLKFEKLKFQIRRNFIKIKKKQFR